MPDQTLPRARLLKRRRLIRALFDRARDDVGSVAVGTIRVLYRVVPRHEAGSDEPVLVGFAPGRRARRATARNRIKRLLREAYRRHQQPLRDRLDGQERTLTLMILFRGDPDVASRRIPTDLPRALRRLTDRLGTDQAGASGFA